VLPLPDSICSIESDAIPKHCRISLSQGCFSPDFERWCLRRESTNDDRFTRIVNRVGVHRALESLILDLLTFAEGSEMGSRDNVSTKRYSRLSDGFQIVVKSFHRFEGEILCENFNNLLLLTQLNHCCIAPLIGIIHPTETTPLKTATLYYSCGSLQDIERNRPVWWTSTTKAKVIAGIALGMQLAHQFGIVHGSLNPNNILFDENHCVHIDYFSSSRFLSQQDEVDEGSGDKEVENAQKADVFSFASILFDILIDRDMASHSLTFDEDENRRMNKGELPMIPEFVPRFVRDLIENGWSPDRSIRRSFENIIKVMKENAFEFVEGVDIYEVFDFVDLVGESSFRFEQSISMIVK
jgi:hypothetical protein